MNSKIKVLGLLGLPLLAIAVAVMVFAFNPATDTTEAATDGASMTLSIGGETGKVEVRSDSTGTVSVNADSIPTGTGYTGVQAWVDFGGTGLGVKSNVILPSNAENNGNSDIRYVWGDCSFSSFVTGTLGDAANAGCLSGLISPPPSFIKGAVMEFDFNCDTDGDHTITLLALGDPVADTSGAGFATTGGQIAADNTDVGGSLVADTIDVNCRPGPTDTPTSTPPTFPQMRKCNVNELEGCDSLQNVFLTRQGSKIPSVTCKTGSNVAGFSEILGGAISTLDPKGDPQTLAAFEFEVHYDNKKACIGLSVGAAFEAAGAICAIEDSNTKPQLEGVARMGCVTQGKGHDIDELVALALIEVRPQPDLYSEMKPNQDNGNTVQINNVNCDIGDEQGHAIAIFSCDDADITYRYLEGDVSPDCVVDTIDAQAIAFRWGVEKGSLIYNDFMNLEPSNQQSDNDIDINDLQFVFGRFGSTCEAPHPPQDPVNPKA